MPQLKGVERRIANLEHFKVTILHPDGRDVRDERHLPGGYPYQYAAKDDFTVAQWKEQRFRKAYPGFDVTVWNADGSEAHGRTKLSTVRDSYYKE
jgi:hypothetical protein